ncbi:MAG: class I SAM-dependent methyltransferase, partial [Acidisphaera sp.]|nr:class I SAM-dependent methyltransferase [Acidisphaera sp.]
MKQQVRPKAPPGLEVVSRETQSRLARFVEEILLWSGRMNLVGDLDEAAVWDRHVLDCLQLAPLMNERPGSAIDMGSGAGFPGLVLAIATGRMIHLVEADQRKAA